MIRVVKEIKRAHELEEKSSNIPQKTFQNQDDNEDYNQEKGLSNDFNNVSSIT
jgi:hypothetical protein